MAGFFRRLANQAVIRARVALAPKLEPVVIKDEAGAVIGGVVPLNEGFFTLERMRKRRAVRVRG